MRKLVAAAAVGVMAVTLASAGNAAALDEGDVYWGSTTTHMVKNAKAVPVTFHSSSVYLSSPFETTTGAVVKRHGKVVRTITFAEEFSSVKTTLPAGRYHVVFTVHAEAPATSKKVDATCVILTGPPNIRLQLGEGLPDIYTASCTGPAYGIEGDSRGGHVALANGGER